jgi:hypothetical protein
MTVTSFQDGVSNDGAAGAAAEGEGTASLPPVRFQLIAEFSVSARSPDRIFADEDLTEEQRRLFHAALEVPAAWNRICRLAIVSEFESDPARWYEDQFKGPEPDHILEAILPQLDEADRRYWIDVRDNDPEALGFYIDPVFGAIRGSLESVKIVDVASGESVPAMISGLHA